MDETEYIMNKRKSKKGGKKVRDMKDDNFTKLELLILSFCFPEVFIQNLIEFEF